MAFYTDMLHGGTKAVVERHDTGAKKKKYARKGSATEKVTQSAAVLRMTAWQLTGKLLSDGFLFVINLPINASPFQVPCLKFITVGVPSAEKFQLK